ncbi:Hsp70 family protein [Actinoplanes solisilvae]|uniref:Hsp70 family protein n=1 Tax=Actinoplanes solisilvae TaxID=2486853 RepID=UPI000FD84917|nr:Hsp70 family protein [Actinoplanes solisilvae]
MYTLGIDLGTTYTAAATWRDGHAEIVSLGSRNAAIPSVVLLREDETFLVGEPANRRGLTEPHRVAREFKRRMGDTTPILLGGVPQSAEALTSHLLRSVVDEVISRESGPPSAICVSHPANWGPYKTDLLRQAVRMADPPGTITYTTEPEAAAVSYAQQSRIDPGDIIAVYDLGGGTFDAAVLRKTESGFEILGQPEGIERLGGIDFDAAVFQHVSDALGGRLAELDEDDPAAVAAVARLREECVQAKEALSADTDTSIPVLLPNVVTEVRLTRSELEAMVRPVLYGSVEALKRAIRSAGCTPEELHSVLLVGGSSRMPIVAELVSAEIGRPVAVDTHPKHAVALGAAWLAGGASAGQAAEPPIMADAERQEAGRQEAGRHEAGRQEAGRREAATGPELPKATFTGTARAPIGSPVPSPASKAGDDQVTRPVIDQVGGPPAGPVSGPSAGPVSGSPAGPGSRPSGGPVSRPPAAPASRRRLLVAAGIALVVVLVGGGVAYAQFGRDDDGQRANNVAATVPSAGQSASPKPTAPADELCTEEIKSNERWACLKSAVVTDGKLTLAYDVDYAGSKPNISTGYHVHFYGSDGTNPPDYTMGSHAPKAQRGKYYYDDHQPSVLSLKDDRYKSVIGNAKKVCIRIAVAGHGLVPDNKSTYKTGNCKPITR